MEGLGGTQRVTRPWTRRRNGNADLENQAGASRIDVGGGPRWDLRRLELALVAMDAAVRTTIRTRSEQKRASPNPRPTTSAITWTGTISRPKRAL